MGSKETNWQIIGHENVKRILSAQLENEALSHAYLFVGPSGCGKRELAKEFANKIVTANSAANISVFDIEKNGSLEDIRQLLELASLTPLNASKKVVILENVHTISPAASNALLKTLEEPANNTVFLLTSNVLKILPTIMSRCQVLNCNRLSVRAELSEEIAEIVNSIEPAVQAGDFRKLQLAKNLAELEEDVLNDVLLGWMHSQLSELKTKPQRFKAVQVATETINKLKGNLNKKMVLEYFVTNTAL